MTGGEAVSCSTMISRPSDVEAGHCALLRSEIFCHDCQLPLLANLSFFEANETEELDRGS